MKEQLPQNKTSLVRTTSQYVVNNASSVKINPSQIPTLISKFNYTPFNQFEHHQLDANLQSQLFYLFVLDGLNFCFWPLSGFEYQHLASNVKKYIMKEGNLQRLASITQDQVKNVVFGGIEVPLVDERARILRQIASVVIMRFDSSFQKIVRSAQRSAVKFLQILTQNFNNFQDHCIYKGHQIHFYKRPQILIGDIYAKFNGKGIGQFYDIHELTMFPDYRVPQILNQYRILEYSESLQQKINKKEEIMSGSREQIEIRACSVWAVEMIKEQLLKKGRKVNSIEVDWFLWEEGEKNLKQICEHHRTLTIYY